MVNIVCITHEFQNAKYYVGFLFLKKIAIHLLLKDFVLKSPIVAR